MEKSKEVNSKRQGTGIGKWKCARIDENRNCMSVRSIFIVKVKGFAPRKQNFGHVYAEIYRLG